MSERSFVMPEVEVGEWVLYSSGPNNARFQPMFVTHVFANNINGILVDPDAMSFRGGSSSIRMNVVHQEDPRLEDPRFVQRIADEGDMGLFVLHPTRLRLEGRLRRLESRLDGMSDKKVNSKHHREALAETE